MEMIFPQPLVPGAAIGIISPATIVKPEYIDGAADFLRARGYEPVISAHAKGPASGSYASGYEERLGDFLDMWRNPDIKAVLCARGGYGTAHLLPALSPQVLRDNAKWLIGFSDISALHAALQTAGVASVHGPMAKHLTLCPDAFATEALLGILAGHEPDYAVAGHPLNHPGEASGTLIGGNLAVLNGLAGTPYDLLDSSRHDKVILFIEDVSEKIYAVERMLWRLVMSGALQRVAALIVGRFTDYTADRNFPDMERMIESLLQRAGISGIPVAYDFPVGHVDENYPMVEGAQVRLRVSAADGVRLQFQRW